MDTNKDKIEDEKSVTGIDTNHETLDRSLINQKRKERRKALQQKKKFERENKARENLQKASEKLQVIPLKQFKKVLSISPNQQTSLQPKNNLLKKSTLFGNGFNILDFIAARKKQNRPIRRIESGPVFRKILKGKKRENPRKKIPGAVKRKIIAYRRSKAELKESFLLDDITAKISAVKLEEKPNKASSTIHSRKFRAYCDNLTSTKLIKLAESLLKDIFRFQKRAYDKNPIKGKAHRRYVVGLHEVEQKITKMKMIIIAPDCEECDLPGGLDETMSRIKSKCTERNILYVFSIRRHRLAHIVHIKVPVSCIGVIDYDGAEETYHQLVAQLQEERNNYNKMVAEVN